MIFFLHFLMMASALFCLSSGDETCHIFKDFISSSKMLMYKMTTMNFQKPMISFVFLSSPMTFLYILFLFLSCLLFYMRASFLRFLLMFFPSETNMTLLSKKRLKIVSWDNFFLLRVMLICHHGWTHTFHLHLHLLLVPYGDNRHQRSQGQFIAGFDLF